jgi:bacterioferritin (cytochrome b1)
LKQPEIKLSKEEFEQLPETWLNNINDQHMFVDFLKSDIQIETARAFKLRALRQLCRSEKEEKFISEKCIREILKETDEDQIYNNIFSNLEPDTKWAAEHTEIYLD